MKNTILKKHLAAFMVTILQMIKTKYSGLYCNINIIIFEKFGCINGNNFYKSLN
jgi:hypothetical protein